MLDLIQRRPIVVLSGLALGYRLIITSLLQLFASVVPLFDVSPNAILPPQSFLQPFVRWDVVWFVNIARRGYYAHEQETAFAWGWLGVIRWTGKFVEAVTERRITGEEAWAFVLGGVMASWSAGIAATILLYLSVCKSPGLIDPSH